MVEIAPLPLPLPSPYDDVLVVLIVAPCIWMTSSKSPVAIAVFASPAACAPTVIDVAPAPAFAGPVKYVFTTPLIVGLPSRAGVAHSAAALAGARTATTSVATIATDASSAVARRAISACPSRTADRRRW